jgi:hypothetical protein
MFPTVKPGKYSQPGIHRCSMRRENGALVNTPTLTWVYMRTEFFNQTMVAGCLNKKNLKLVMKNIYRNIEQVRKVENKTIEKVG